MKNSLNDIAGLMATMPLFAGYTPEECEDLSKRLNVRVKSFAAHEMIVSEVNAAKDILVVCSGRLHVYECGLKDDSRHLVQRLYAGDSFGAALPVMGLREYPAMILSETEGHLLQMDVEAVRNFLQTSSGRLLLCNLYAATAKQGFYAWRKLMLLSCYEIADRVLLYLRWHREDGFAESVVVNYPELSAYLGVNRSALYRAIDKLVKAGKIRKSGACISLLAPAQGER